MDKEIIEQLHIKIIEYKSRIEVLESALIAIKNIVGEMPSGEWQEAHSIYMIADHALTKMVDDKG